MKYKGYFTVMVATCLLIIGLAAIAVAGGLSASGNQVWHLDSTGILGSCNVDDYFGRSLAWGDFNGDGYADLAVGASDEDVKPTFDAGAVHILYGSATGLTATGNQRWNQDSPGILDTADTEDRFGDALAAGDFNGDGYADLAVGVDFEDIGGVVNTGAVNILYGSATGLTSTGNQFWHQGSPGTVGANDEGDFYGAALATGDFNNDGYADLAVGVPGEDAAGEGNAGRVHILYGSAGGLSATGNQTWQEGSSGLLGLPGPAERFGAALTVGDFNGDGYADLAVGVPGESGPVSSFGSVYIIHGSASGLSAIIIPPQIWAQDMPGVLGDIEAYDEFGLKLAAGDFNRDGYADLAVGVQLEDISTLRDAGAVNVLYGSAAGLSATGNQLWHQDSPGIQGGAEEFDWFGSHLAAGDFNGDGYADLAVGVSQDHISGVAAGAVNILYGSSAGLSANGNQIWYQGKDSILETAEASDWFGNALAAGDFNGNGCADLAVGVVGENFNGKANAGVVNVLYGYSGVMPWLLPLLLGD